MSKKIRITNTTAIQSGGGPGFGLEFQGNYIASNRQLVIDIPVIPVTLETWQAKGWIRIEDADAAPVSRPGEAEVTPGIVVAEASASQVLAAQQDMEDLLADEEFDLSVAKEATLPAEAAAGVLDSTDQVAKASVTLGLAEERVASDTVSPIPGDKPRHVGDAEKFTVRAPRAKGVGAVVKA